MRDDFLVFGSPQIEQPEIDEVIAVLKSGWLGTGPRVKRFQTDFAAYKGVNRAVAANSCTAALHLSLLAAGVGKGDEVITTPMTFCASINAIIHSGATPVLADVDPELMNISVEKVEKCIGPNTRAIMPVHFAGRPCDMDGLTELAEKYRLLIIEDCAHAIESHYNGRPLGTIGDFGCFSFYSTKNVITGEGGMVLARNEQSLDRTEQLALHGMSRDAWNRFGADGYKHYEVVEYGFKYNMMDVQAAIGIHQLARVEKNWERRQEVWNRYMSELADLPLTLPADVRKGDRHAYHLFTVLVDETRAGISRDRFLQRMKEQNIGVGVHYQSVSEHPVYQERLGWTPDAHPEAARIGRQTASIPLSAKLTDQDVESVIAAIRQILS